MRDPNQLIRCGVLPLAILTAIVAAGEASDPLLPVLATITAFYGLGILLLATRFRRSGARLVLVASLLVLPIGLLGAFGARGVLDELDRQEARR